MQCRGAGPRRGDESFAEVSHPVHSVLLHDCCGFRLAASQGGCVLPSPNACFDAMLAGSSMVLVGQNRENLPRPSSKCLTYAPAGSTTLAMSCKATEVLGNRPGFSKLAVDNWKAAMTPGSHCSCPLFAGVPHLMCLLLDEMASARRGAAGSGNAMCVG